MFVIEFDVRLVFIVFVGYIIGFFFYDWVFCILVVFGGFF